MIFKIILYFLILFNCFNNIFILVCFLINYLFLISFYFIF